MGLLDSSSVSLQNWFLEGVKKIIGDGSRTLFWHDLWSGSVPLSIKFKRLYNMSNCKMMKIQDMGKWIDGNWTWDLSWRRRFFEWEHDLFNQLMEEIQGIEIRASTQDHWRWKFTGSGEDFVKLAYNILVSDSIPSGNNIYNLIWKHLYPTKLALPTKRLVETFEKCFVKPNKCCYRPSATFFFAFFIRPLQ